MKPVLSALCLLSVLIGCGNKEEPVPLAPIPDDLNPDSLKVIRAYLEPSLKDAKGEERFQFERHGYFVVDDAGSARTITRTVTLRDSWSRS